MHVSCINIKGWRFWQAAVSARRAVVEVGCVFCCALTLSFFPCCCDDIFKNSSQTEENKHAY